MTRFTRPAGITLLAVLTALVWLPLFLVVVLLMFAVLLLGLAFATAALWLNTAADHLLDAAADAADDLDTWFVRMTGWRA